MSITIKDLLQEVAETGGVTKQVAEHQISAVFSQITEALKNGDEVVIRDFGRFITKVRPSRPGRNPKTGEPIQVPEKRVYKFVPRGAMKDE